MKLTHLSSTALNLLGAALFQTATATPPTPGLSYLGTATISITSPFKVGQGPLGDRNVYPITGGSFTGPNFTATVPHFGGDWGLGDPLKGNFYIDARYQLQTPDGADILVTANGPQQPDGTLYTRVKFETGHPNYKWLNGVVAVAITTANSDLTGITVDIWKMEKPVEGKGKGKRKRESR